MKIAIVLFNLGGPNNQQAVEPFLFNLFNDAAIIRLPQPLRYLIAKLISVRRSPIAREIYAKLGGGSPILKNTQDQAQALESQLNKNSENTYKTFIAMRYWHPFSAEAAQKVKAFNPSKVILLPLYPQFSTTTTASSIKGWKKAAKKLRLNAPAQMICCYPDESGFISALAQSTRIAFEEAKKYGRPRILFSAHGLPEKIIAAGDPYRGHCEITAEALRRELGPGLAADTVLCFQSRVGPLKWIGPATDDEVRRAGRDKVPVVVVPVAFVSDHSETLVELDIEYRHLAQQNGVPFYTVIPAVGTADEFINSLADLITRASAQKKHCISSSGARICPQQFAVCPCD